jgi:hypothetical protein
MPRRPAAAASEGEPMCWMMVLLVMYLYWGASFSVEVVFSMRDCRIVFWGFKLAYIEREV